MSQKERVVCNKYLQPILFEERADLGNWLVARFKMKYLYVLVGIVVAKSWTSYAAPLYMYIPMYMVLYIS
jgi:hypothetical protein